MTLIRFSGAAMGRSRFALSPLAETLSTLMALERNALAPGARRKNDGRDAYVEWRDADPTRRGLLALVSSTKWFPGFFGTVPARGMATRLDEELVRVGRWTNERARCELEHSLAASWRAHDTAWLSSNDLVQTAVCSVAEGYHLFVEADWPRRRLVMERDIMRRAGLLAAYGWREATEGMTRASTWAEHDALTFSAQAFDDIVIGEEGMIFVPHTASNGSWTCDEPPRYALVYPAWGVGVETPDASAGLARLLGPGTAAVLQALSTPATPSQLALLLDVSLGTVSGHLRKLTDAGAVVAARIGRSVRYYQTDRGERLVRDFGGDEAGATVRTSAGS